MGKLVLEFDYFGSCIACTSTHPTAWQNFVGSGEPSPTRGKVHVHRVWPCSSKNALIPPTVSTLRVYHSSGETLDKSFALVQSGREK